MVESRSDESAVRFGILTVSDRASQGVYADRGGPEVRACLDDWVATPFEVEYEVVPDEVGAIGGALVRMVDVRRCCVVVTTGGTGPALRDVTVEASGAVWHKPMPGFGELMRQVSLRKVPTAILSRQEAGIRFRADGTGALIVNLPGSPKAVRECLEAVFPAIPYCIELVGGPIVDTHEAIMPAYRPQHARKQ